MQINELIIYKNKVSTLAWDSYIQFDHAQVVEGSSGTFVKFNTVPQQTSSVICTVSSFAVDKHHPLLWHLDDGIQEEHMLDMDEVLMELSEHPEELAEFKSEVDITAENCLLIKAW